MLGARYVCTHVCVSKLTIAKDKIFVGASKTMKPTKILVLKIFRLYGSYVAMYLHMVQITHNLNKPHMSHACCFCGVGGCLATLAFGYTRVHAQTVLHMCVPTHTQSVYTWVLLPVSHSMYILQSSYFVSLLQILVRVFPRVFPCRIGFQTMQSV